MTDAQALFGGGALLALSVVAFAAWREQRRARRRDLDVIGLVSWPTVQLLALLALAVCVGLALNG